MTNNQNHSSIVGFIWSVADEVLRDDFKRSKYPDVILPFTVLRRLDCVLAPTRDKVRQRYEDLRERGLQNVDPQLRRVAGYSFYNLSKFDFPSLAKDPRNLAKNLRAYINGFSEQMHEVIDKFKLSATIESLDEKGLLFLLIQKFSEVDLHPDAIDNHQMGTIFEELIRKFNEQSNENPGEHFTPREVIRLMVRLVLNGDKDILKQLGVTRTVFDPACGTGGMLSIAKEYIHERINSKADIRLYGQEVNDETFAVCKSDLYIKGDDKDAENIKPDSCLSKDGHAGGTFDYMLTNPPYGKDWKKEKDFIEDEAARGESGRFSAGLPRISDGQLLFLQHMLSKMSQPTQDSKGGSRIAIVMNGSPLFTGDAGSGESEIRRWIMENDYLETIVALPGQLFYNTGINTYVWVLTNRKQKKRRNKVLLINGAATRKDGDKELEIFASKMKKSLGDKRNELTEDHIEALNQISIEYQETEFSKIFDSTDFGYRKVTVEKPLRLNFQASSDRIEKLKDSPAYKALIKGRKKGMNADADIDKGKEQQELISKVITLLDSARVYKNRDAFLKVLQAAAKKASVSLNGVVTKIIVQGLSERDPEADICVDTKGRPEPDPDLRDYENVPLKQDIYEYYEREVRPHVPDAWINEEVRDVRDGKIGKVGYEISFNRYFYRYEPPRALEEIESEISALEEDIANSLKELMG